MLNTKICTRCKENKEYNQYTYNLIRNQYMSRCKTCRAEIAKEKRAKYKKANKSSKHIKIDNDLFDNFMLTM